MTYTIVKLNLPFKQYQKQLKGLRWAPRINSNGRAQIPDPRKHMELTNTLCELMVEKDLLAQIEKECQLKLGQFVGNYAKLPDPQKYRLTWQHPPHGDWALAIAINIGAKSLTIKDMKSEQHIALKKEEALLMGADINYELLPPFSNVLLIEGYFSAQEKTILPS